MSTQPKDGGPAFPVPPEHINTVNGDNHWVYASPGMSLRDWFAGQALTGVFSNHDILMMVDENQPGVSTRKAAASYAYAVADAMLAARERKEDAT